MTAAGATFWSEYQRLQRRIILASAAVELALWVVGQVLRWKYRNWFWHPAALVEGFIFTWPPLTVTGVYLLVLLAFGFVAHRLNLSPRPTAFFSSLLLIAFGVRLMWLMYESTT